MTFEEMRIEVKEIKCDEIRTDDKNHLEVVIAKEQLKSMTTVLQSYFGPPLKPAGEKVPGDVRRFSEPYGGIWQNQTLYCRKNENITDVAILWPWGCGTRITVKIIRH